MTTERDLRQEWATPDDFWKVVHEEFEFNFDAAATRHNAMYPTYFGPDHTHEPYTNGLSAPWLDVGRKLNVWINPPFAKMMPWVLRAHNAIRSGEARLVVLMCPASPETKWWKWAVSENYADDARFLSPRVQFVPPPGVTSSTNRQNTALLVFRTKPESKPCTPWTWNWKRNEISAEANDGR